MTTYHGFVGIDIAMKTADIAVLLHPNTQPKRKQIQQTPAGYRQLHIFLDKFKLERCQLLIVMESTGPYWRTLAHSLSTAGFCVSVVNPLQAHYFAKFLLQRSKTDIADAHMLAKLAITQHAYLPIWTPPPPVFDQMYQLLLQRDQLTHIGVQRKNRHHALKHHLHDPLPNVIERDEDLRQIIEQQRWQVLKELETIIQQHPDYKQTFTCLTSLTGIGTLTACWLIYVTQNFELFPDVKQLASFVGLVPRAYESGISVQKPARIGHSGHPRLRQLLYNAAMSAVQNNAYLKQFYTRLRNRGKKPKVALIAVAHKLLVIAFALVEKGELYDPDYHLNNNN